MEHFWSKPEFGYANKLRLVVELVGLNGPIHWVYFYSLCIRWEKLQVEVLCQFY